MALIFHTRKSSDHQPPNEYSDHSVDMEGTDVPNTMDCYFLRKAQLLLSLNTCSTKAQPTQQHYTVRRPTCYLRSSSLEITSIPAVHAPKDRYIHSYVFRYVGLSFLPHPFLLWGFSYAPYTSTKFHTKHVFHVLRSQKVQAASLIVGPIQKQVASYKNEIALHDSSSIFHQNE